MASPSIGQPTTMSVGRRNYNPGRKSISRILVSAPEVKSNITHLDKTKSQSNDGLTTTDSEELKIPLLVDFDINKYLTNVDDELEEILASI
jgi:hypothetical protein